MEREDFIFTIGYQGNSAIIDGQAKKNYGKLSTLELAENGLYKPAFCSAVYSGNPEEMDQFIKLFSYKMQDPAASGGKEKKQRHLPLEDLKRTFGVFGVPEGIEKVIII